MLWHFIIFWLSVQCLVVLCVQEICVLVVSIVVTLAFLALRNIGLSFLKLYKFVK